MPTNKSIAQVSINIELADTFSNDDKRDAEEMPHVIFHNQEIAKYDHLMVEVNAGATSNYRINTSGQKGTPGCCYAIFLPVLLLSAIAYAPIYHFAQRYQHIQDTYTLTMCNKTSYKLNDLTATITINASYFDSQQNEQWGEFNYQQYYDYRIDRHVRKYFRTHVQFPCYYNDPQSHKIEPEDYVGHILRLSQSYGIQITLGLFGSWLFIAVASILLWRCCHINKVLKRVDKAVFEKTGIDWLDVLDWNNVNGIVRQFVYSLLYVSLNVDTPEPRPIFNVRVTRCEFVYPGVVSRFRIFMFTIAAIFIIGLGTMVVEAFLQDKLYNVQVCWCLLCIITIAPSVLIVFGLASNTNDVCIYLDVNKRLNGQNVPHESLIIRGGVSPMPRQTGYLMSGRITYVPLPNNQFAVFN